MTGIGETALSKAPAHAKSKQIGLRIFLDLFACTLVNYVSFCMSERFCLRILFSESVLHSINLPTSEQIFARMVQWSIVSGFVIGVLNVLTYDRGQSHGVNPFGPSQIVTFLKSLAIVWFAGGCALSFAYNFFPRLFNFLDGMLPGDWWEATKFTWAAGAMLSTYVTLIFFPSLFFRKNPLPNEG